MKKYLREIAEAAAIVTTIFVTGIATLCLLKGIEFYF